MQMVDLLAWILPGRADHSLVVCGRLDDLTLHFREEYWDGLFGGHYKAYQRAYQVKVDSLGIPQHHLDQAEADQA